MDTKAIKDQIALFEMVKNIIEYETNVSDFDKSLYQEVCTSLSLLNNKLIMSSRKDSNYVGTQKEDETKKLNQESLAISNTNVEEIKSKNFFDINLNEATYIGLREKYIKTVKILLKVIYKMGIPNNELNNINRDGISIKDLAKIIIKHQNNELNSIKKSH